MFEDNRVARDQRWRDGVDRGHVRVVPRRYDEHDAMRNTFDVAFKGRIFAHLHVRKAAFCDLRHIARAFFKAAEFATVAHRATHHVRQFWHDFVVHRANGSDASQHQINAFLQRTRGPCGLCCTSAFGDGKSLIAAQRITGGVN